jgi:hypothetical protein
MLSVATLLSKRASRQSKLQTEFPNFPDSNFKKPGAVKEISANKLSDFVTKS